MFEIGVHLHLSPMSVDWPCLASGSCIGLLSPDLHSLPGLRNAPLPTSTAFPRGWGPIVVKEGAVGVGELRGPGLTFLALLRPQAAHGSLVLGEEVGGEDLGHNPQGPLG